MYVETICIKNGRVQRVKYHEARMNRTRAQLFDAGPIKLRRLICVPNELKSELVKCRVLYNQDVQNIQYEKYTVRPIKSIKLVRQDSIDYAHKSTDRNILQELFEKRGNCDDILIVKNGLITDTYYANVALHKDGRWYTPSKPLLEGTRRAQLIEKDRIEPKQINVDELSDYDRIAIFNAMIPLGKIVLPINQIIP